MGLWFTLTRKLTSMEISGFVVTADNGFSIAFLHFSAIILWGSVALVLHSKDVREWCNRRVSSQ